MEAIEHSKRLTLIFIGASDSLDDRVLDIRALVHNMEVLTPGLTHDARVPFVHVQVVRDVLPQLLEHVRGTREVQRGEGAVRNRLADDLGGRAGDELDDARGDTGFGEDLVDDVVRVCGHRRWLPDHDVAEKGRCYMSGISKVMEWSGSVRY